MSEPAILGKGLVVRGRVRGQGDLRIEADVTGDVVVQGALELGAGCSVAGGVEAESLVVAGALEGDVNARGSVVITAGGSVRGDIQSSELSLEEGGQLVGEVNAEFDLPEDIA